MNDLGYVLAHIIYPYWLLVPLSIDTHNDPFGHPGEGKGEATRQGGRTKGAYGYQI